MGKWQEFNKQQQSQTGHPTSLQGASPGDAQANAQIRDALIRDLGTLSLSVGKMEAIVKNGDPAYASTIAACDGIRECAEQNSTFVARVIDRFSQNSGVIDRGMFTSAAQIQSKLPGQEGYAHEQGLKDFAQPVSEAPASKGAPTLRPG